MRRNANRSPCPGGAWAMARRMGAKTSKACPIASTANAASRGPAVPTAFSASHRCTAASIACIRCQKPTLWSGDQVQTRSPGSAARKHSANCAAPAPNQSSSPAGTGSCRGARPGGSQPAHSPASPSQDRSPRAGGCCIRSPTRRATNRCTMPRCSTRSVTTHSGQDGTAGAARDPAARRAAASKAAASRSKCPT